MDAKLKMLITQGRFCINTLCGLCVTIAYFAL